MMGTKKLGAIRDQIRKAMGSAGDDPIQRLDRDIADAQRKGDNTNVMEDLKRFLKSPQKRKGAKRRARAAS